MKKTPQKMKGNLVGTQAKLQLNQTNTMNGMRMIIKQVLITIMMQKRNDKSKNNLTYKITHLLPDHRILS